MVTATAAKRMPGFDIFCPFIKLKPDFAEVLQTISMSERLHQDAPFFVKKFRITGPCHFLGQQLAITGT